MRFGFILGLVLACAMTPADAAGDGEESGYPYEKLAIGDLYLTLKGGATDRAPILSGPGTATPGELGKDELVYQVGIGFQEKPVVSQIRGAICTAMDAKGRACRSDIEDPWNWALFEALSLDAGVSYGATVTNPEGDDNFEIERGTTYSALLSYKLSIEDLADGVRKKPHRIRARHEK